MSLRTRVLIGTAVIAVVLAVGARRHDPHDRGEPPRPGRRPAHRGDRRASDDYGSARRRGRAGTRAGRPPRRLSSVYVGAVEQRDRADRGHSRPRRRGRSPLPDIDADVATAAAASDGDGLFTVGAVDSDLRYRVLAATDPRTGDVAVVALPLADVDSAVDRLIVVAAIATIAVLAVVGAGHVVGHPPRRPTDQADDGDGDGHRRRGSVRTASPTARRAPRRASSAPR